MKVTVRRSGGFANIAQTYSLDSDELDAAGKEELERAVDALRDATEQRHPDTFRYQVEADDEEFVVGECWAVEALVRLARQ